MSRSVYYNDDIPGCMCYPGDVFEPGELRPGCAIHDAKHSCPQCGGQGYRHIVTRKRGVTKVTSENCLNCQRTGRIYPLDPEPWWDILGGRRFAADYTRRIGWFWRPRRNYEWDRSVYVARLSQKA